MRKSLNLFAISIVIFTLMTGAAMAAEPAGEASAPREGVVNINTAEAAQLQLLPRVGPKAAERIIEYRKEHGNFKKTSDLMQVKGIGDKTFELLDPYLTVEGKTTLSTKIRASKTSRSKAASPAS